MENNTRKAHRNTEAQVFLEYMRAAGGSWSTEHNTLEGLTGNLGSSCRDGTTLLPLNSARVLLQWSRVRLMLNVWKIPFPLASLTPQRSPHH